MGLVNEVVPAGESLARAVALAQQLAAFPQTGLRHDRLAVYEGLDLSLQEGLKVEAAHGEEVMESGEPAAGAVAFRDARRSSTQEEGEG